MTVARLKRIFVGFAVEDEWARNLLRGHAKLGDSPIEYADFSVKIPWDERRSAQHLGSNPATCGSGYRSTGNSEPSNASSRGSLSRSMELT
jgi:hypothetical protein